VSRPFLQLGDGVEIRLLQEEDAQEVFELIDAERERLRPWMPWADTTRSADEVRTFIRSNRTAGTLEALGIFVAGGFVGGTGLVPDGADPVDAEVGVWISAANEGHGLASRACRAMIGHAFGSLGVHRVTACVAPDNARSRTMVERLGFTREGVLREAGRTGSGYVDLIVYGLLEHEWAPQANGWAPP